MRTHVTFHSDLFETDWESVEPENPCCLGEDLVDWIAEQLAKQNENISREFSCQEDWGWALIVCCDRRSFMFGVGGYEIEENAGWLCFVKSRLPFFKRWFGVDDTREQRMVCRALHQALESEPQISDIRWHDEADFSKGNEDTWTPRPDVE